MLDFFKRLFATYQKPDFKIDISQGTGFEYTEPTPDDWILGSSNQAKKIVLSPLRDYSNYLPVHERQDKLGYDSFACVVFSGLNCLEIFLKKLYGEELNFSDRFLAGMIPVKPYSGTNYSAFWDAVRDYGLVLEEKYPFAGTTPHEYVKRPPQEIIDQGKNFLQYYDIEHEWIDWGGCDPNKLYEALQFGPLHVSIDGNAARTGKRSTAVNHSVTIYRAEKGVKWGILDHYSRQTYEVPWNFYFGSAKQATILLKKKIQLVQRPWMTDKTEASKVFAIFGGEACHIADEYSWNYGSELGIWDKTNLKLYTEVGFNQQFTLGKQLSFK